MVNRGFWFYSRVCEVVDKATAATERRGEEGRRRCVPVSSRLDAAARLLLELLRAAPHAVDPGDRAYARRPGVYTKAFPRESLSLHLALSLMCSTSSLSLPLSPSLSLLPPSSAATVPWRLRLVHRGSTPPPINHCHFFLFVYTSTRGPRLTEKERYLNKNTLK